MLLSRTMPNNLESTIHEIIASTSSEMAKRIAQAVRQSVAAAILGTGIIAPERRKPGRPKKQPGPPPEAKATTPAARPTKRRKPSTRRLVSAGEMQAVLDVVSKKPGLTSVQIQKEAGIDSKQAARVLTKLRKINKVKTKGDRSRATYTLA